MTLDASSPAAYGELGARIAAVDKDHGTGGNVLYYLATAPNLFADIVQQLGDAGLTGGGRRSLAPGRSSRSRSATTSNRRGP